VAVVNDFREQCGEQLDIVVKSPKYMRCESYLVHDNVSNMLIETSILEDSKYSSGTTPSVRSPNHVCSEVFAQASDIAVWFCDKRTWYKR
jgi:hypothetical protein